MTDAPTQITREELLTAEAVREVGVLFVTFAPLDVALSPFSVRAGVVGLSFVLLGILFFRMGLRMERRRANA